MIKYFFKPYTYKIDGDVIEVIAKLAEETASEEVNERVARDRMMGSSFFRRPYKPINTISVVELKRVKKKSELRENELPYKSITKRGGIKFKMRLGYVRAVIEDPITKSTRTESKYWYTADIEKS